jgi:hypothetical protein
MDDNVLRFRKGGDARSIPPIRVPGEQTRDTNRLITLAADVLGRTYGKDKVQMLFINGTGIGGPICDQLKRLGHEDRIMEVQFGAESPDPKYANMRAFIWGKGREWLRNRGAIDDSPVLETDLPDRLELAGRRRCADAHLWGASRERRRHRRAEPWRVRTRRRRVRQLDGSVVRQAVAGERRGSGLQIAER